MRKLNTFQSDGLWLVASAAVMWGTIGVATQTIYNTDTTTSLFINLARMLIATPLLLLACWRIVGQNMLKIKRRDACVMLISGTLLAISHAGYFAAIRLSGVTIATLLTICVAPIVVLTLSILLKFETLTRRGVIALILAVLGSMLLVGLQSPQAAGNNLLIGTIFSIVAAICYGSTIVCGRFVANTYHPLQITSISFCFGTLVLIAINVSSGIVIVHTSIGWLMILYLGIVPTTLAYWLFQTGLRSVSASAASIAGMLDPLVAALLAWLLFGETLAGTGVIGAMFLLLSMLILSAKVEK